MLYNRCRFLQLNYEIQRFSQTKIVHTLVTWQLFYTLDVLATVSTGGFTLTDALPSLRGSHH